MCKEKLTKLINIMEVNKMLEVFLFNVTVGGLILSVAGMIGLELSENFKKEYKIVKRKSKISKLHSTIKTTNSLRIKNPRSNSCFYNVPFHISRSKILMSGKC